MFNIFKRRPKPCTSCGVASDRLHSVYAGLRHGERIANICTACLGRQLVERIEGKEIAFIEPLTGDGYTYLPVDELPAAAADRIQLTVSNRSVDCEVCGRPARHVWIPINDTDEELENTFPIDAFYLVPAEPDQWEAVASLCSEHVVETLTNLVEERRYRFLTFRFPDASTIGYYS
ncbi:MAG TPA: hypothetical protein VGJ82_16960 [Thermoanaerobaculia bacterium]